MRKGKAPNARGKTTGKRSTNELQTDDIGFEIQQDSNVRLKLDDGAVLRLRPVIVRVNKTKQNGPDGKPVYIVTSFMHLAAEEDAPRPGKE